MLDIFDLAVFNPSRTQIRRLGDGWGWSGGRKAPRNRAIFVRHGVQPTEGSILWVNETTREAVVTVFDGHHHLVVQPSPAQREEAQNYWDWLDGVKHPVHFDPMHWDPSLEDEY